MQDIVFSVYDKLFLRFFFTNLFQLGILDHSNDSPSLDFKELIGDSLAFSEEHL